MQFPHYCLFVCLFVVEWPAAHGMYDGSACPGSWPHSIPCCIIPRYMMLFYHTAVYNTGVPHYYSDMTILYAKLPIYMLAAT
jgi:hypothetical protein